MTRYASSLFLPVFRIVLFSALHFGLVSLAAAAVRLDVSTNPCALQPCPCCITGVTSVRSGEPVLVAVVAVDEGNGLDSRYTGTIEFSSTDSLATLPATYSLVQSDGGRRGFSAILRTPGVQQITVTDAANVLAPGTLTVTVTGPLVPEPIPVSVSVKIALALGMAISGFWILRIRA